MLKKLGITAIIVVAILSLLFITGLAGQFVGWVFYNLNKPSGDFDASQTVAAPDYSNSINWSARPERDDPADLVPEGVKVGRQGSLPVDTFFIHPTGYLKSASWTSPMDPNSATEENTSWMMANQASAYNGCCNVYAPRYREATIFSYFGDAEHRDQVLGFAYEDVKRAFEHYIKHDNNGRPFIISSHSQGTHHALRLLKEVIDPSDLHERLVAAYLIGSVLIPVSDEWFASMTHITACQSADDLSCVVHWDTMPDGAAPIERPAASLCTNPLTWRVEEERAEAALNEGAVPPEGTYNITFGGEEDVPTNQRFESLEAPLVGHVWAQCREGSLFVGRQEGTAFQAMGSGNFDSYHGLDYALFYMNIHNNAKLRASTYLNR